MHIYEETDYLRQLLVIVNVQSNNLRGDKKNNKRHFFEGLSITLQRENGSTVCFISFATFDDDVTPKAIKIIKFWKKVSER